MDMPTDGGDRNRDIRKRQERERETDRERGRGSEFIVPQVHSEFRDSTNCFGFHRGNLPRLFYIHIYIITHIHIDTCGVYKYNVSQVYGNLS